MRVTFNDLMKPHVIAPIDRIFQEKMKLLNENQSLLSPSPLLVDQSTGKRRRKEEHL